MHEINQHLEFQSRLCVHFISEAKCYIGVQKRDYGTRTSERESEEKSRSGRNTTIVGRRGTERERAKEVAGTAVSELRNDGEHKMATVRQEHNMEPLEGPHQGSTGGEPV